MNNILKKIYLVIIILISTIVYGNEMRIVEYNRHEFRFEPELRKAPLITFVYDIPYFGACGIFPPYHILNEYLLMGGSQGGMGPGTTWDSFKIQKEEYDDLVKEVKKLEPKSLGESARYTFIKYEFDNSYNHINNWEDWLTSVCEKHRDSFHRKIGNA